MIAPLPRRFFDRNAAEVAPELVGCLLVRRADRALRIARIVETEAYVGEHDLACHAKVGRTARTDPMYGPPGHAYVYFIYGMHHCVNAVCGPGGAPNAVLLRAAAPLDESRRTALGLTERAASPLLHSATGPGNLCRALGIDLGENRADLCDSKSPLWIARGIGAAPVLWTGPRIGVDYAAEWAGAPLRFCDRDDAHVSRPRPPRAKVTPRRGR